MDVLAFGYLKSPSFRDTLEALAKQVPLVKETLFAHMMKFSCSPSSYHVRYHPDNLQRSQMLVKVDFNLSKKAFFSCLGQA